MQRFAAGDSNAVCDMHTGDKSWFYCYDLKTKRQSAEWVFSFDELLTTGKRGRSIGKNKVVSFFRMTEHARRRAYGKRMLMRDLEIKVGQGKPGEKTAISHTSYGKRNHGDDMLIQYTAKNNFYGNLEFHHFVVRHFDDRRFNDRRFDVSHFDVSHFDVCRFKERQSLLLSVDVSHCVAKTSYGRRTDDFTVNLISVTMTSVMSCLSRRIVVLTCVTFMGFT
ncbi:hypothetical protein EVAR_103045_1 [Eumeta japonica]|uniref:Uncharacterized protein n=1 Tax=Eumeta variegata TaxID=151549 RepID=A0A4C1WCQ8_EUMVA|nr:hypothetical protein EVAR_103045_1 [Eumeta japonica]